MKVAYLTTYYNGAVDGRFGRFHDWVHTLRDMDDPPFEFEVVALTASNPDETLSSIPHGLLGTATELWGTPKNKVEFCANVPRTLRDLWRIDYDVLHVLTLDTIAYPVALANSRRHPVVGPDVMGYTPRREGPRWEQGGTTYAKDRIRFALRKGLIGAAKRPSIVALSENHAANVRELNPKLEPTVIPPGVGDIFTPGDDATPERSPSDPTHFLYVGDLSVYKGYEIFLDALAQLPNEIDFTATVVGTGDPMRDRIVNLDLADRVTVEGFVPREDLPRYYRQADFYVMPSVDENGPNTIVEALACGTPVVATDKLGTNEYGTDDTAIYVERSPQGIRKGLTRAHEHRAEYATNALERADRYSARRTLEGLADLYEAHLGWT